MVPRQIHEHNVAWRTCERANMTQINDGLEFKPNFRRLLPLHPHFRGDEMSEFSLLQKSSYG